MPGMTTLADLYLGSEPTGVTVQGDLLLVSLADGQTVAIPLRLVSQVSVSERLPAEAQLLVVRRPPKIDHVHVTDSNLNVYLEDGRLLSCPLSWFPRLLHGSPAERSHYVVLGDDNVIHWPDLDEDIEVLRLFEGGKSVESERSIQRWLASRAEVTA